MIHRRVGAIKPIHLIHPTHAGKGAGYIHLTRRMILPAKFAADYGLRIDRGVVIADFSHYLSSQPSL